MTDPNHYDTISIGSGEAGKYLCWTRSSTLGVRTAVLEDKYLGGSCPNVACLPSKNLVYSAQVAHTLQKYSGISPNDTQTKSLFKQHDGNAKGDAGFEVDMSAVINRKRNMIDGLMDMHKSVFANSGAELILGRGRLVGPNAVQVTLSATGEKRVLTANHIILCTGSRAKIDSGIPGLLASKPLTHVEILELEVVPDHLVILGAGYVGLEFAQVFRRFGAKVSVLERGKVVLKNEDEDVSSALVDMLEKEGVQFFTQTTIQNVTGTSGESVTLTGSGSGDAFEITGTHLLVASGRVPNTEDVGLQDVGVELTPTGHVKVDEYLRTSVNGIFAVGDCAGSPHFTHVGFDDFRIVRDFLLDKQQPLRSTRGRQVPYTLYTDPELAHVGLSEKAAKKQSVEYRLAKLPMAAFLRTRTMDATGGFAKALVSAKDDTILGFTALGPRAGELLPVVQLAMSAGLPYTSIADMIVTHPTMNEGLVSLFGSVQPRTA